MHVETWMWAALGLLVVVLLLIDLLAFGRRKREIPFREAVAWSIGWTVLGLAFAGLMWAWQGRVLRHLANRRDAGDRFLGELTQ